jgi:hypothetical protein
MNPTHQILGALKQFNVPAPIINQFTTHISDNDDLATLTRYWAVELNGQHSMFDSIVYLNDVKGDATAWLNHFYERVVPYLKTRG